MNEELKDRKWQVMNEELKDRKWQVMNEELKDRKCSGLPLNVNTVMASERFVDTLLTSNLKPLLSN